MLVQWGETIVYLLVLIHAQYFRTERFAETLPKAR